MTSGIIIHVVRRSAWMGKPYSKDLRARFVALLEAGASASGAGKQLLIARSTATRWGAIWTTEKRCEALPMGVRSPFG